MRTAAPPIRDTNAPGSGMATKRSSCPDGFDSTIAAPWGRRDCRWATARVPATQIITSAMAKAAMITGRIAGVVWPFNEFTDSGGERMVGPSRSMTKSPVSGGASTSAFGQLRLAVNLKRIHLRQNSGEALAQAKSDGSIEKRLVLGLWVLHNSCTPSGKTAALPIDS